MVIDNLPNLAKCLPLANLLAGLTLVLNERGNHLVTTGHHDIPSEILSITGDISVTCPVAGFELDDVIDVLSAAEPPSDYPVCDVAASILVATTGHPVLVSACIGWLRSKNWPSSDKVLKGIFIGDPGAQAKADYDQRAHSLVNDGTTRRLLDRISLISMPFDTEVLRAIASVNPCIEDPVTHIDQLVGIWANRLPGDRYTVTPLLRDVGNRHLPPVEQIDAHKAVATVMLSRRTIDVSDAFSLAMHLLNARMFGELTELLIQLLLSVSSAEQAKLASWATYLFAPNTAGTEAVERGTQMLLCALQIRTRVAVGLDASDLRNKFSAFGDPMESDDVLAFAAAYSVMSLITNLLDPVEAAGNTVVAYRLLKRAKPKYPQAADLLADDSDSIIEMIWASIPRFYQLKDVIAFVDLLEGMTTEELNESVRSEVGLEGCRFLTAFAWCCEQIEAEINGNWQTVLDVLSRIRDISLRLRCTTLRICAERAISIVLADYKKDYKSAVALLGGTQPETNEQEFIIRYTKACILYDNAQYEESLAESRLADARRLEVFGDLQLNCRAIHAYAAHRLGYSDEAVRAMRSSLYLRSNMITVYDRIEMLGELAWLQWRIGDRRGAFVALNLLVRKLELSRADSEPKFLETFRKAAHALGWYSCVAETGYPPTATSDGSDYVAPSESFFRRSSPLLASLNTPIQFGGPYFFLSCMATSLDLGIRARATSRIARRYYAEVGDHFQAAFTSLPDTEALASEGDLANALRHIDPLRNSEYERQYLFRSVYGPAMLGLLVKCPSGEAACATIHQWQQVTSYLLAESQDLGYWLDMLEVMRTAFDAGYWDERVKRSSNDLDNYQRTVLYLAITANPATTLRDMASGHAVVLDGLVTMKLSAYMLKLLAKHIAQVWSHVAATQGFRLNMPKRLRDAVDDLPHKPTIADAARILLAAELTTGATYPAPVRDTLGMLSQQDDTNNHP